MPRGRLRPRGNSLLPRADRMRSIPVRPKTRNAKHSESSGGAVEQLPRGRLRFSETGGLQQSRPIRPCQRKGPVCQQNHRSPTERSADTAAFLTESMPDGHSTEKKLQMYPGGSRGQGKGFEDRRGPSASRADPDTSHPVPRFSADRRPARGSRCRKSSLLKNVSE